MVDIANIPTKFDNNQLSSFGDYVSNKNWDRQTDRQTETPDPLDSITLIYPGEVKKKKWENGNQKMGKLRNRESENSKKLKNQKFEDSKNR